MELALASLAVILLAGGLLWWVYREGFVRVGKSSPWLEAGDDYPKYWTKLITRAQFERNLSEHEKRQLEREAENERRKKIKAKLKPKFQEGAVVTHVLGLKAVITSVDVVMDTEDSAKVVYKVKTLIEGDTETSFREEWVNEYELKK